LDTNCVFSTRPSPLKKKGKNGEVSTSPELEIRIVSSNSSFSVRKEFPDFSVLSGVELLESVGLPFNILRRLVLSGEIISILFLVLKTRIGYQIV
jgi:hypothetical protein